MSRWKSREARVARSWSSRRKRREELEPRGGELAAEPELGGRPGHPGGEERLGLVRGQAGEPRAVAAREPVAAGQGRAPPRPGTPAAASDSMSRWTVRTEISSMPGELGSRELAARLEHEQQRDEPRRTHLVNMTEDGLFVCKSLVT